MKAGFVTFAIIATLIVFSFTIGKFQEKRVTWHFPINLGDNQEYVQEIAGMPDKSSPISVQWYSDSGFSIVYDDYQRVTEIHIAGEHTYWHRYEPGIINSLNSLSTYEDFVSSLGNPDKKEMDSSLSANQYTATWKKENINIEADFWLEDLIENEKIYPKNSLIFLSLKRSL